MANKTIKIGVIILFKINTHKKQILKHVAYLKLNCDIYLNLKKKNKEFERKQDQVRKEI